MRALKKDTENKISIEKKIYQPPAGFMVLEEKWLTSSPSRPSIPSSPSSPWETRTGRNQKRRSLPHAYLETHPVRTCNLRRNYSTLDPGNPRTPCKRYNNSQPCGWQRQARGFLGCWSRRGLPLWRQWLCISLVAFGSITTKRLWMEFTKLLEITN